MEPVCLVSGVTEDYVSLLFRLELPWTHEDYVAFANPVSFLHLASYSADTGLPVLTLDIHSCLSIVLLYDTQYIVLIGHFDAFSDVALIFY